MDFLNGLAAAWALALAAGATAGGLRWAAFRRHPLEGRHPLWRRDIAAFGFVPALTVFVFGSGSVLVGAQSGVLETIDRAEVAVWALGLFAVVFLPFRAFFGPLYRDADWDFGHGYLLSLLTPVMLFTVGLLAVDAANSFGDRGLPGAETMTVTAVLQTSDASCGVELQPTEGAMIVLPGNGAACDRLTPGTAIRVPVRPGLLGARWVALREVTDALGR